MLMLESESQLTASALAVLVCPLCHGDLTETNHLITCTSCTAKFELSQTGIPVLHDLRSFDEEVITERDKAGKVTAGVNLENVATSSSFFSRFSEFVKKNSWLLGPSIAFDSGKAGRFTSLSKKWEGAERITLNIGSRGQNLWDGMISTDIYPTEGVSLACDAHKLPFGPGTVDCLIATSLFEHLRKPAIAAAEVCRVLKKDGEAYIEVPWMYEVHGVPLDFQRWTLAGLEELFFELDVIEKGVSEGPMSTLARMTRQCAASFFGNRYLHYGVRVMLTWLLFWMKYLDWLIPEKNRVHMAMGYYILLRKK